MTTMKHLMRGGLAAALFLCALWACGGGEPEAPRPEDQSKDPAAQAPQGSSYRVRGVVVDLPDPERPTSDFVLLHEAIPDWIRMDGERGMPAMQMPFVSETPTDLSHVSIGDKVEMTWITWWEEADGSKRARSFIRDVKVLDPETELELPGG